MEMKKVLIIYNPNSGKREKTKFLCAKYKELLDEFKNLRKRCSEW